jgi:hypothetical protein
MINASRFVFKRGDIFLEAKDQTLPSRLCKETLLKSSFQSESLKKPELKLQEKIDNVNSQDL